MTKDLEIAEKITVRIAGRKKHTTGAGPRAVVQVAGGGRLVAQEVIFY